MNRTVLVVLVALLACASSARAADRLVEDTRAAAAAAVAAATVTAVAVSVPEASPEVVVAKRPRILIGMYVAWGVLQTYDGYSTITGVASNHVELNPVMAAIVKNPGLVVTAKVAMTAATIITAENLWRNHHRGKAIALMVVSNGVMAAVAARNATVVRGPR